MNREWVRGGLGMVGLAVIGIVLSLALGSDGDAAGLIRGVSLLVGGLGVLFVLFGAFARRDGRTPPG